MTDCIRIDNNNCAAQIWSGKAKADLVDENGPLYPDTFIAGLIEVISGSTAIGDVWNGVAFKSPITLSRYNSIKRFEVETGGVTVNGNVINTTRESQGLITGAMAYAAINPSAIFKWKLNEGNFVDVDVAGLTAIASAVAAHVQACFAKEADVAAAVASDTITDKAGIDAAYAAL